MAKNFLPWEENEFTKDKLYRLRTINIDNQRERCLYFSS